MTPLTVIIPSCTMFNLRVSVPAVRRCEPDARIIIVDDGVTWQDIPAEFDGAETLAGQFPFVFSRNINIGIRGAEENDVVLLNDDAILQTPGGFSIMQRAAEEDPQVGIIGAVTDLTGQPEQRRGRNIAIEETARELPGYGLRAVEHIAFVCVLIPKRTRDALALGRPGAMFTDGYLDERYNVGYGSEDLDYCMQCQRAALCVCVHDGCYVDHGSLRSSFRGDPKSPGDIWPNHRLLRAKWGLGINPQDPGVRR